MWRILKTFRADVHLREGWFVLVGGDLQQWGLGGCEARGPLAGLQGEGGVASRGQALLHLRAQHARHQLVKLRKIFVVFKNILLRLGLTFVVPTVTNTRMSLYT